MTDLAADPEILVRSNGGLFTHWGGSAGARPVSAPTAVWVETDMATNGLAVLTLVENKGHRPSNFFVSTSRWERVTRFEPNVPAGLAVKFISVKFVAEKPFDGRRLHVLSVTGEVQDDGAFTYKDTSLANLFDATAGNKFIDGDCAKAPSRMDPKTWQAFTLRLAADARPARSYDIQASQGYNPDKQPGGAWNANHMCNFEVRGRRVEASVDGRSWDLLDEQYLDGPPLTGTGRRWYAVYGETINGVQAGWHPADFPKVWDNQIHVRIDPYVVPGDPSSGLLRGIEPLGRESPNGSGDHRVQAYCFRACLTDVPENRIPFAKPEGYDARDYEILFRLAEAGEDLALVNFAAMPNRKTDTNSRGGFSTDFVGANWDYPEASDERREEIVRAHLKYQRGLFWTLANHPRVPAGVRAFWSRWGTCRDEFADGYGDGWQRQLYVREARRMVGAYVMTERDCRRQRQVSHPVALAAYGMDSHNVRRHVVDGRVANEGDVQDHGFPRPYPVEYLALVPRRGECANLLVPVCLSASHIAYGSIRMEPVFFALGQVAGTAAAQAVADGRAVQDVDYGRLRERLVKDGMVIE